MPKPPELTTRQKLLGRCRRQYRDVLVPGVGNVRLKSLTAREQLAVADSLPEEAGGLDWILAHVAACVVDEDDSPVFGPEDLAVLGDMDARTMSLLCDEASELCGLKIGVKDAAKN